MLRILTIDPTLKLPDLTSAFWKGSEYRIEIVHARSMQQAIKFAGETDFWHGNVNVDELDCKTLMPVLRTHTNTHISALTSDWSKQHRNEHSLVGCNISAPLEYVFDGGESPEGVAAYIYGLSCISIPSKTVVMEPKAVVHNSVVLSADSQLCYIGNTEVALSRIEFNLLYCLIRQKGRVQSYLHLYHIIRDDEMDDEVDTSIIHDYIRQLNRKVNKAVTITCVKECGYCVRT
ncbi:MAG: winged helix-turn-helix domain-containing protein [Candidatus Fimivivens sp.]